MFGLALSVTSSWTSSWFPPRVQCLDARRVDAVSDPSDTLPSCSLSACCYPMARHRVRSSQLAVRHFRFLFCSSSPPSFTFSILLPLSDGVSFAFPLNLRRSTLARMELLWTNCQMCSLHLGMTFCCSGTVLRSYRPVLVVLWVVAFAVVLLGGVTVLIYCSSFLL